MTFETINPATGELMEVFEEWPAEKTNGVIAEVDGAWWKWRETSFARREELMKKAAALLRENLVVFVDRVSAGQSHTLDLAIHLNGQWGKLPEGKPVTLPGKEGYQHLRDVSARSSADSVTLDLGIVLAGGEPTEVITATGVGRSTEDRIPLAIFRRRARQTTYAWAASLDGSPVKLAVTSETAGAVSVRVEASGASWLLAIDTDHPAVRVTH